MGCFYIVTESLTEKDFPQQDNNYITFLYQIYVCVC